MGYIAEFHPRINTISVSVESATPFKGVTLNPQNNLLCLVGDDIRQYVLPHVRGEVVSDYTISKVRTSANIVTVNIDINREKSILSADTINPFVEHQLISKWSCKYLEKHTPQDGVTRTNEFQFQCAECSVPIVHSEQFKFMDMPSEWWHELMEFWHCHKPHQQEASVSLNNYNGILKPKLGTIIIGSYYLLANSDDKTLKMTGEKNATIFCHNCTAVLGEYNEQGHFYKMMKWNLKLAYNNSTETFSENIYFYELLMDRLNITATRWFQSKLSDGRWMHIWLINTGSNVIIDGKSLSNALKLGFRIDNAEINDRDNLETLVFAEDKSDLLAQQLAKVHNLIKPFVLPIQSIDGEYLISYLSPDDAI